MLFPWDQSLQGHTDMDAGDMADSRDRMETGGETLANCAVPAMCPLPRLSDPTSNQCLTE